MNKPYKANKISTPFYKTPSLFSGLSRVLDLGCTFDKREFNLDNNANDFIAIQSDWAYVGLDITHSIDQWNSGER